MGYIRRKEAPMPALTAAYHENRSRGTLEFPFDYHYIDREHPRFVMPYH